MIHENEDFLIEEDDYDDNGRGGDIDDEFSVGVAHKYIGEYLYRLMVQTPSA